MAYTVIPMTPMKSDEYRAALDKLGISQLAAGRLFAVGARTSRRWALDEARIPAAVAMLLRLMVKKRLKLEVPIWSEDTRKFDSTQIWTLTAENKLE
jgi:hypothetical protein